MGRSEQPQLSEDERVARDFEAVLSKANGRDASILMVQATIHFLLTQAEHGKRAERSVELDLVHVLIHMVRHATEAEIMDFFGKRTMNLAAEDVTKERMLEVYAFTAHHAGQAALKCGTTVHKLIELLKD